jgi:HMG (high mobility group) box
LHCEQQPLIKQELGDQAIVTNISKRSAEMWKNLSAEERAMWDDVAAKDKQRYMVEKAMYNGPWQVPWKRVKKVRKMQFLCPVSWLNVIVTYQRKS